MKRLIRACGLPACGLVAMLGVAADLRAQPPDVPPDGIVFRNPFVTANGFVIDPNQARPDSLQFRDPFVDAEGNVTVMNLDAPSNLEFREVLVDVDGNVIRMDVAPPSGLEFRDVFLDVDGNVLIQEIAPPQGIVFRDPFLRGDGQVSVSAVPETPPGARLLSLSGVVPNPFNPGTQISFRLREAAEVTADVLDLHGRLVRRLQSGWLPADLHVLRWDGRDSAERPAASGVYMFRIRAGAETLRIKGVLLK